MILETIALGLRSMTASLPGPDDDRWFDGSCDYVGSAFANTKITPDSALQTTAVNACVGKRSRAIASLPLHIYEKGGPAWKGSKRQKRNRVPDHPLERILGKAPNDWQTADEFIQMMEGHECLRGNAYAVIVPGSSGAVHQLIPKHPDRMEVFRLESGRLGYLYTMPDGHTQRYTQDQIFHLRGQTFDGLKGISPIALHCHTVELAQHAEDHGLAYYKSGKPSGLLKFPEGYTFGDDDEARDRFKRSWREAQSGNNLLSVAVLEDGLEWQQLGMTHGDAQYLESRQFQVIEICRIFDVPPILIYSEDGQNNDYTNTESKDLWFKKYCLGPWLHRWEQTIWRDLIVDQDRIYAKFSFEGLLRGDSKAQAAYFTAMIGIRAFCPNDVLELLDRNPYPEGEKYYLSTTLRPADQADQAGQVEAETGAAVVRQVEGPPGPKGEVVKVPDDVTHLAWAQDIAARLAAAELRALADHVLKAAEDRERFNTWVVEHWGGKHRAYVERTVGPYLEAQGGGTAEDMVERIVLGAVETLLDAIDPVMVYETWKIERAGELAQILGRR